MPLQRIHVLVALTAMSLVLAAAGASGCSDQSDFETGSDADLLRRRRRADAGAADSAVADAAPAEAGHLASDGGSSAPPDAATNGNAVLTRQGNELRLGGAPYKYVGLNFFGLGGCEGGDYTDAEMDAYFASLRPNSITRTWAFEAQGLSALTRAIHSAEAHHQMLILSLADAAGYCNETDGRAGGEGSGKTSAWYASGYKTKYIPWVKTVVSTFKDSSAIGMWELMNEPGNGTDVQTLRALFDDAAGVIKAIDPVHLVESGTLAEYVAGSTDYATLHGGPNVDVGSLHEYDYDYQNSHTIVSPHLAATLDAMNSINKPLIVGESGINGSSGGNCTSLSVRADAFKQKFDGYLGAGAVGVTVWNYYHSASGSCDYSVSSGDPLLKTIHGYVIP